MFVCLVAPIATSLVILKMQKKQVKREVKRKIIAGIDKSELVLLKFTHVEKNAKLRWEHAKEFEYNGEMYDVVESKVAGDTNYYWCWWDNEETTLCKKLDELLYFALGHNPKKQENQKRLLNFYKSLFFAEYNNGIRCIAEDRTLNFYSGQALIREVFYPPPCPPPEKG